MPAVRRPPDSALSPRRPAGVVRTTSARQAAGGALPARAGGGRPGIAPRPDPAAPPAAARAWDLDAPVAMKANGHRRGAKRRVAASLAFTTLFLAGAAFSAGAGDQVAQLLETSGEAVPTVAE